MKIGRRSMTKLLAGAVPAAWMSRASAWQKPRPIAPGAFQPTWDSLKQYQAPEWFRDAKFGIWAHWTAQCVPEQGDWYARQMYRQGQPQYDYHVAHYGHPSRFGFMQMYVKAGAKYFVSLANHHDNFDCFDSAHHPWNALHIGPKKDIVGTWAR